jgi:hypothetical protein
LSFIYNKIKKEGKEKEPCPQEARGISNGVRLTPGKQKRHNARS